MRIMVFSESDADTRELVRSIAEYCRIPVVELGDTESKDWEVSLEKALPRLDRDRSYVLRTERLSLERAMALDAALDNLDIPLELAVCIDTETVATVPNAADGRSGQSAICDYYRRLGLLRKLRGEGEPADINSAMHRIIDDRIRARLGPDSDPFAVMLNAVAHSVTPATSIAPSVTGDQAPAAAAEEEPGSSPEEVSAGSGWRHTAEQKGRIRRRPAGRKIGPGGRTPKGRNS